MRVVYSCSAHDCNFVHLFQIHDVLMKIDDTAEGESKSQTSKQKRRSSQEQLSADVQKLDSHATEPQLLQDETLRGMLEEDLQEQRAQILIVRPRRPAQGQRQVVQVAGASGPGTRSRVQSMRDRASGKVCFM